MKEFKLSKLSLDNASSFRVYYLKCAKSGEALMREFKSLKSMNQWIDRCNMEFDFIPVARCALIDNEWQYFVTVGNRNVTLPELDLIVKHGKETISDFNLPPVSDFGLPPFRMKNKELQKSENEERKTSSNDLSENHNS
jgi:hypothetical protein